MATDSFGPLTHTPLLSGRNALPKPGGAWTDEELDAARGDGDLAWLSLSGEEVLDIDHELLLLSLLSIDFDEEAPFDQDRLM